MVPGMVEAAAPPLREPEVPLKEGLENRPAALVLDANVTVMPSPYVSVSFS